MADVIFIRDLRVETVIGCYEWERRIRQAVTIDLDLHADVRKPASSDRVEDAVNYKEVAKRVLDLVAASEFRLVEALAEAVARAIVTEFPVARARVSVGKPGAIRGARTVGVAIERTAADYA